MHTSATVVIIGGSGFVGRHLTDLLIQHNKKVIILTRASTPSHHDVEATWVTNSQYSLSQLTDLFTQLPLNSCVINLVGQLHDKRGIPYGPGFKEAHIELPQRIIRAMESVGLKRLIHVSSLGANKQAPSMYQRSKGAAEELIKASSLDWTILRPSVIFGRDDQFIQLFASLCKVFPVVPLASSHSRFQPVAVNDVVMAIDQSIELDSTIKQSIDLAGPKVYTLKELVEFAGRTVNRKPIVIPIPHSLGYLQALAFEHLPGKTLMSRDNLASMTTDNVLEGTHQPLIDYFKLTPTPLETLLS